MDVVDVSIMYNLDSEKAKWSGEGIQGGIENFDKSKVIWEEIDTLTNTKLFVDPNAYLCSGFTHTVSLSNCQRVLGAGR